MPNVGVIYATGSKILRAIVIPDVEPAAVGWGRYHGPGESFTLLPSSGDISHAACIAKIKQVTATAVIPSGRCAVVDGSGNVVNVINADPALDSLTGFTIVASDDAAIGDHYNVEIVNNFSRRYAVALISTKVVSAISWLAAVGATPPDGTHFIINSLSLQIGDTVKLFVPK